MMRCMQWKRHLSKSPDGNLRMLGPLPERLLHSNWLLSASVSHVPPWRVYNASTRVFCVRPLPLVGPARCQPRYCQLVRNSQRGSFYRSHQDGRSILVVHCAKSPRRFRSSKEHDDYTGWFARRVHLVHASTVFNGIFQRLCFCVYLALSFVLFSERYENICA